VRQLGRQRAGAAARDDEHGVVGKLRQRVRAFGVSATDGLNDLAVHIVSACGAVVNIE
jgi:hypothetical protein